MSVKFVKYRIEIKTICNLVKKLLNPIKDWKKKSVKLIDKKLFYLVEVIKKKLIKSL